MIPRKTSATILRIGLSMDLKHQYSEKYLKAKQKLLDRPRDAIDSAIQSVSTNTPVEIRLQSKDCSV